MQKNNKNQVNGKTVIEETNTTVLGCHKNKQVAGYEFIQESRKFLYHLLRSVDFRMLLHLKQHRQKT